MTTELPVAALKADLFKALAHPVRVRALEQLVLGEVSVGELADRLDLEVTQLSQQLAVLRRANVVVTRRDGNTIFYSLRDPRVSQLLAVAKQLLMTNLEDSRTILASLEEEGSRTAKTAAGPRR
ncbi:ArsR family transcriptional regulator [Cryobacterium mesophilum]|uniref:ArsR family transcriptional regulator n=1 Tax=Terrimesophilobacter mesophilus TaxID=433647 RepID=A0A4R8V8L0_9MICO|nr:metalloregulator ArsR/SmtB family transcription factor [Terrimesophilobacter mesophilus]MBB5632169.1 ArsR family transcriptional regulator [Terrimesophilobacter mesophilus]TFB79033.1 ArsR family transcriptional regulator [Terrimesophilobacter mesophilus]